MAITNVALAEELGQRLGPAIVLVNVGSVAAWALREMGYAASGTLAATDTDLSALPDGDVNEFLDFSRYESANRILDNLDPVQLKEIGIKEDVKVLRPFWEARVKSLRQVLRDQYTWGTTSLKTGVIDMDFQARGDDVTSASF